MNRRDFFKFAGRSAAALGVVAATGLPDVDKAQEEVEWEFNIPKYNSDARIVDHCVWDRALSDNEIVELYVGGSFDIYRSPDGQWQSYSLVVGDDR